MRMRMRMRMVMMMVIMATTNDDAEVITASDWRLVARNSAVRCSFSRLLVGTGAVAIHAASHGTTW